MMRIGGINIQEWPLDGTLIYKGLIDSMESGRSVWIRNIPCLDASYRDEYLPP